MIWAYLLIALAVVAGGVTAVETYNHAISAKTQANARAVEAEQRAQAEHKARTDLEELVGHEQKLVAPQQQALSALGKRLGAMEAAIRQNAARDPKAYACESAAVPDATRELRRDSFGPAGDELLRPPGAGANASTAATGRDLRPNPPGSGPAAPSAPAVQQRQGDSAGAPAKAEPATLRARLESLMRR